MFFHSTDLVSLKFNCPSHSFTGSNGAQPSILWSTMETFQSMAKLDDIYNLQMALPVYTSFLSTLASDRSVDLVQCCSVSRAGARLQLSLTVTPHQSCEQSLNQFLRFPSPARGAAVCRPPAHTRAPLLGYRARAH